MIEYNKLIRDKIPEIIVADDKKANTRVLSAEEYKSELLKKLLEEAAEVLEVKENKKDMTKEIGDVMEVMDSIVKEYDLDVEEIIMLKEKRREERGGFDKRLFLESVE